jgi:hypothetical protein
MTRPLQVLKAFSIAEIRSTPHGEAAHVEYILLPGRDRWLWIPSSSAADDSVNVLALSDASGCRCCGGRGRFERWQIAADSGGGGGGGVTDHGALTGLADDDHPQYTTAAEAAVIADASAAAAVAAHEAALNPHPDYTTEPEVEAIADAAAAAAVAAHQAAGLDDHDDVDLGTPAVDDVLKFDGTKWVNAPAGANAFNFGDSILFGP